MKMKSESDLMMQLFFCLFICLFRTHQRQAHKRQKAGNSFSRYVRILITSVIDKRIETNVEFCFHLEKKTNAFNEDTLNIFMFFFV